jgi:hypothetical protein
VWYDYSADLMRIVPQQHFDHVIAKYQGAKVYVDEYELVADEDVSCSPLCFQPPVS